MPKRCFHHCQFSAVLDGWRAASRSGRQGGAISSSDGSAATRSAGAANRVTRQTNSCGDEPMGDIRQWLTDIGLERFADAFEREELTPAHLPKLSESELKDLGLPSDRARQFSKRSKPCEAVTRLRCYAPRFPSPPKPLPTKTLAPTIVPDGERRQLTVLFCDMVGFTELANRVDPEVLQRDHPALRGCVRGVHHPLRRLRVQKLGDGIVAFFGYPLAHEGEAERAIHAGLEIIEALSKLDVPEVGQLAGAHRHRHRAGGSVLGREGRGGRDHESRLAAARHRRARQHRGERAGAAPGRRQLRLRGSGRADAEGHRPAHSRLSHRRA